MPATNDPKTPAPERPDSGASARTSADPPPALPVRSTDDTDVGWSERPEPDDEQRLRDERPPHWDAL